MVYDCIVIGTGPAGISAALNLKIREKEFLLIGSEDLSEKLAKAENVENYPGFPDTSGKELKAHFKYHLMLMDIDITDLMVNSIRKYGDTFAVMAGSEFYETKSVILASGVVMENTIPGEDGYVGKGISYCATCDGGLYRDRHIAVICNNKRFEHEVKYLAEIASAVEFYPQYAGYGAIADNVSIHMTKINSITGDSRVRTLDTAEGEQAVDGIFILRDSMSLSALLPELETEEGHIKVDRGMATSVPGVYAAGDCTGRPYQYAKAVGEGNVAAHSVLEYLEGNI